MIGLIGVLTAAALSCTSMPESCAPELGGPRALAAVETVSLSPEMVAPKPRMKPVRSSAAKLKQKTATVTTKNDVKTPSAKPKVKLVMQDDVKKSRKKKFPLLIGNYY